MDIDFNKIEEIYGTDILKQIKRNYTDVSSNINYLSYLGFDVTDLFERETLLFLEDSHAFKHKVDCLIKKIGSESFEKLDKDISLWEALL